MRRVTRILVLACVAVAAGSFWGCNEKLDDPTDSEGLLIVEKVNPANVQADVTPFDPNGVTPTPLTDDSTVVTLKNRLRNEASGDFSDIFIMKTEQSCTFGGATIASGSGVASFTIPAGGSADVTITAVTVAQKALAIQGDSWKCSARFIGEDLAGNPAKSEYAQFVINFVDK